jgi:putative FmdB family regulatory protein
MPIYEYRCEECGDFEEMQRITDAPLARCPRCRRKVRRLISQTSFQLKGSGWYVTDYGRTGEGGKKKKESGGDGATASEAKPADKAESKADAKPAAGGTNASSGT